MDMSTAKVTTCRHFFHSVCLKKWLYMQDPCPLCHAVLYKDQILKGTTKAGAENEGATAHNQDADDVIDDVNDDENDLVDHDDPPYQAPPLIVHDSSSSSDEDGDAEAGAISSSSASTGELYESFDR